MKRESIEKFFKSDYSKFKNPKPHVNKIDTFKKILKKILLIVLIFFIVYTLTFFILSAIPGEPKIIQDARAKNDEATVEALRRLFDLHQPLFVRYLLSFRNIFNGTFGYSGTTGASVLSELAPRFLVSMQIGIISIILSLFIGLPLAVLVVKTNNRAVKFLTSIIVAISFALPLFLFGMIILMISFFTGGPLVFDYGSFLPMLLPALAIAIPISLRYIVFLRSSLPKETNMKYAQFARIKGLSENQILIRHTLKPSMQAIVNLIPTIMILSFVGSVSIERVFAIPGSGDYLVNAALESNANSILGVVTVYTIIILLSFALRDILTSFINPKSRIIS